MFSRVVSLLFVLFLSAPAFAKDVILYVFAEKSAPQVAESDYTESARALNTFEVMAELASANIPKELRPEVLRVEVSDLNEIPEKIKTPDARIRMMLFSGHGGDRRFWLHNKKTYNGKEMAEVLTSEKFHPLLAKDVGIYIAACNCGSSDNEDNFQMELMKNFREKNEALHPEKQTRSFVSIAHRYMSSATSFAQFSLGVDTLLYKKGVFKYVESFDKKIFQKYGRAALNSSFIWVPASMYAIAYSLNTFVGADAVGEPIKYLLEVLPKVAIGAGISYLTVKAWAGKWVREMTYDVDSPHLTSVDKAGGNALSPKLRGVLCQSVF